MFPEPICNTTKAPVFGLAGFVLPVDGARGFGTWFYKRKCELLAAEIEGFDKHPALWEKRGAKLYTATNASRYSEVRRLTYRLLNKIRALGGFILFVGIEKTSKPETHKSDKLYGAVFVEVLKRIDQSCAKDCDPPDDFILILDENSLRPDLLNRAAKSMYAETEGRRHLIEQPFHAESHRCQTFQAADWIAGLIGRLGAVWCTSDEWPENELFRRCLECRTDKASERSGVRTKWTGAEHVHLPPLRTRFRPLP